MTPSRICTGEHLCHFFSNYLDHLVISCSACLQELPLKSGKTRMNMPSNCPRIPFPVLMVTSCYFDIFNLTPFIIFNIIFQKLCFACHLSLQMNMLFFIFFLFFFLILLLFYPAFVFLSTNFVIMFFVQLPNWQIITKNLIFN